MVILKIEISGNHWECCIVESNFPTYISQRRLISDNMERDIIRIVCWGLDSSPTGGIDKIQMIEESYQELKKRTLPETGSDVEWNHEGWLGIPLGRVR